MARDKRHPLRSHRAAKAEQPPNQGLASESFVNALRRQEFGVMDFKSRVRMSINTKNSILNPRICQKRKSNTRTHRKLSKMPRLPNSLLLLITVLAPSASAIATCWRNDNHSNASSIFVPCNTQTPFSMCYRSQTDAGGNPPDKLCLPNGLVQNIDISGEYQYWRQSCTDQTWASPYCLNAFDACTDVSLSLSPRPHTQW